MKQLLSIFFCIVSIPLFSQLNGTWHASFTMRNVTNKMLMSIEEEGGKKVIYMSNPASEKLQHIKMDNTKITDNSLSFTWTRFNLSYEGTYYEKGDSIHGVMSQLDVKWAATFFRDTSSLNKQTFASPNVTKNVHTREVKIPNKNITLAATLTLPKDTSTNFPIVILASGTGPQNRDCEILGHKPFAIIADYLAQKGIASLRFDDRGTGKSTGNFQSASLKDIASDVNACVTFLASNEHLKSHLIGIAGHSEGGMHALMVAKKNKKVKFLLELASIGTDGLSTLVEQQYLIPLKEGYSDKDAQWNKTLFAQSAAIVLAHKKEKASDQLSILLDSMWVTGPEKVKKESNILNTKLGINLLLNNVWGREFLQFKAADYLKKIKVPILAINGGEDIQVPPKANSEAFNRHFSMKSGPQSKALIIPGKNHLFQTCKTCTVEEYKNLNDTFSEDVLTIMSDWITKVCMP